MKRKLRNLDEVLANGVDNAKKMFSRHGTVRPTFCGFDGSDYVWVSQPSFENDEQKAAVVEGLRLGFRDTKIVQYWGAFEAWMVVGDQINDGVRPKDHPQRIEVVWVLAANATAAQCKCFRIVRSGRSGDRPMLVPAEDGVALSGSFAELLKPEGEIECRNNRTRAP